MNWSFVPCELPSPWTEFRTRWYKKGNRLHRQSLIESVHGGQLLGRKKKNHVHHVLGLLTQPSMKHFNNHSIHSPSSYFKLSSSFHTAAMCISHTQDEIIPQHFLCHTRKPWPNNPIKIIFSKILSYTSVLLLLK